MMALRGFSISNETVRFWFQAERVQFGKLKYDRILNKGYFQTKW